jgi:uncharacterized protein YukE
MPGVSGTDIANLYTAAGDWDQAASAISDSLGQAQEARQRALSGWTGSAAEAFARAQSRFETPAEQVSEHFRSVASILREVASQAEAYNSTLASQQAQIAPGTAAGLGGLVSGLLTGL